jgi:hypothetical protein
LYILKIFDILVIVAKTNKKLIRNNFNEACLKRDNYKCIFCDIKTDLDVHHVINREKLPNGGYVKSNGITLCSEHHLCAEQFHITGTAMLNFHPDDLFKIINSSYVEAYQDSLNLNNEKQNEK